MVGPLDMRVTDNMTAATLILGCLNGSIQIWKTNLSHLHFTLQQQFKAYPHYVRTIHIHHFKPVFVSASVHKQMKVWMLNDTAPPRLLQCFTLPDIVNAASFSSSGLLVVGCRDGVLRVYGGEPRLSLRSSVQVSGQIFSVAWSPSNQIAATFRSTISRDANYVQVWDSSFRTLFKFPQENIVWRNNGLVFASNNLLCSSGGYAQALYWYHLPIPTNKVMNVLVQKDMLPFCHDVLKIIITYLPVAPRVVDEQYSEGVGPVAMIGSKIMILSTRDYKFHFYNVGGNNNGPRLIASVSIRSCSCLAGICTGRGTELVIAFVSRKDSSVEILTVSQVWVVCVSP